MLGWVARMGAVTAEALGGHERCSVGSARARLLAAQRDLLVVRARPLLGMPSLYSLTRRGVRACGRRELAPVRVTAGGAAHAIACAEVAVALECAYPAHRLLGEPELRAGERGRDGPLASVPLGRGGSGVQLHRADLALCPARARTCAILAVEVELTAKAPRRLAAICRAWARCAGVSAVLYVAAEEVEEPLARAIRRAGAGERIVVVPLAALLAAGAPPDRATTQTGQRAAIAPIARAIPGEA